MHGALNTSRQDAICRRGGQKDGQELRPSHARRRRFPKIEVGDIGWHIRAVATGRINIDRRILRTMPAALWTQ